MKSFEDIIADLLSRVDCHFHRETGLPQIPADLRLPSDLTAFYARFSEAQLFGDPLDPRCHLLPPDEFVQVGAAIIGQATNEGIERSWYALAHVQDGNYLAIDLLPARLGWCYDCFHETYGEPGDCKVISLSFTELLNRLADAGDSPFWLDPNFTGYGDAYDKTQ
jgi:hypothetical protein